jgi:DNA polymerase III delta' subunit
MEKRRDAMLAEKIAAVIKSGKISHAWLLTGEGAYIKEQALVFGQALLCENPRENGEPCGFCSSCAKILSGNHPDLLVVEPDGASIKIHQIRAIRHFINLTSYEGGRQVIILQDAHTMQLPAANSLLKSLEEPPAGTYFILTAPVGDTLLPTILSRVVWLKLNEAAEKAEDELKSEQNRLAREFLGSLDRDISSLFRLVANFKEDKKRGYSAKKQAEVFLEQLLLLLRDDMATELGGQAIGGMPSGVFDAAAALKGAALVEEYLRLVRGNINVNLLLTVLAIKIQDLYKQQV